MTVLHPNAFQPSSSDEGFPLDDVVTALRLSRENAKGADPTQVYVRDLPSPEIAAGVVKGIFAALFPRHGGGQDGHDVGLDYFVGHALNGSLRTLRDLVEKELKLSIARRSREETDAFPAAHSIVRSFATRLPDIRDDILTDVRAAFDGDPAATTTAEILLSYPGIKATFHHRLAHELYKLGAPIVARIISEISHSQTGIDIHPGAAIGRSFFIDHGTGVVIGETAIIGERVRLYQAVTLGAKRFDADDSGSLVKGIPRHPIVQDDVVIYAGATILGRVTIGRGSIIGGSVWLTNSVPPGSCIVQARARSEQNFMDGAGI